MTKVFRVFPGGMQAMFDAHHAQEAAEHGECNCPPGVCLEESQPVGKGEVDPQLDEVLDQVGKIFAETAEDFFAQVEADVEKERLDGQLQQLGDIVEETVALVNVYAALVNEGRD